MKSQQLVTSTNCFAFVDNRSLKSPYCCRHIPLWRSSCNAVTSYLKLLNTPVLVSVFVFDSSRYPATTVHIVMEFPDQGLTQVCWSGNSEATDVKEWTVILFSSVDRQACPQPLRSCVQNLSFNCWATLQLLYTHVDYLHMLVTLLVSLLSYPDPVFP